MGHGASRFLFCIYRFSMRLLCITTTKLLHNYQTNKTQNRSCSVDTHLQDGAGSVVLFFFAYKGWQHFHYVYSLPNHVFISRHTRPEMVHAPLTLVFKMGQGASRFHFCVYRLSMLLLCITTTKLLHNSLTNKT